MGDRRRRRWPPRDPSATGYRGGASATWSARRATSVWTSPWTSPSSAPPTIQGPSRTGFAGGTMEKFVQYARIRAKISRTSTRSSSRTPTGRRWFDEMKGVVLHWIDCGVTVFRVDNPHTKPFAMWEWLITDVRRTHPEAIFLSEAFTRPRVMHRLAKLGFSQSYTYFTWRNTRAELTEYLTELHHHRSRDYFRPNLWPNTPDILPEALQLGGRPASIARLILAATMGANYGIYGPAFELVETTPREPGSEEYLDSEKYQIASSRPRRTDSAPLITRGQRDPALESGAATRLEPALPPGRQRPDHLLFANRRGQRQRRALRRRPRSAPRPVRLARSSDRRSRRHRPGQRPGPRVAVRPALHLERRAPLLQLDPSRSPAQVFGRASGFVPNMTSTTSCETGGAATLRAA